VKRWNIEFGTKKPGDKFLVCPLGFGKLYQGLNPWAAMFSRHIGNSAEPCERSDGSSSSQFSAKHLQGREIRARVEALSAKESVAHSFKLLTDLQEQNARGVAVGRSPR